MKMSLRIITRSEIHIHYLIPSLDCFELYNSKLLDNVILIFFIHKITFRLYSLKVYFKLYNPSGRSRDFLLLITIGGHIRNK